jgi:hypothetical protein
MLVATWVNSSFGVLMEGPVLGIWFWFALGFSSRRSAGFDGLEELAIVDDSTQQVGPSVAVGRVTGVAGI